MSFFMSGGRRRNKPIDSSPTPPIDTTKFWVDTTQETTVPKYHNGTDWVPMVPVSTGDGSGGAQDIYQVTKMNVTASSIEPHVVELQINYSPDFRKSSIEVLRFEGGTQDLINTISSFTNGEQSDFNTDDQVIFDGRMYLKTSYQEQTVNKGLFGEGKLYEQTIDKTKFKKIEKIEVM